MYNEYNVLMFINILCSLSSNINSILIFETKTGIVHTSVGQCLWNNMISCFFHLSKHTYMYMYTYGKSSQFCYIFIMMNLNSIVMQWVNYIVHVYDQFILKSQFYYAVTMIHEEFYYRVFMMCKEHCLDSVIEAKIC